MVVYYGDESGAHGSGDYVISGYLSHRSTWDLFNRSWIDALPAPPPRSIDYLKMSEWEHRYPEKGHSGQFLGWNDFDAEITLAHMVSILRIFLVKGAIGEFTGSVSWDSYRRCVNGDCKTVFSDPYFFIMRQITLQAVRFTRAKDPAFAGKHCCPAKIFHQPGTPAESVS